MARPWEYENRARRRLGRRLGFQREAQVSGFAKVVRDSLISRGLDPNTIEGLMAPPTVTKPIDRGTIKQVVHTESEVRSAQRDLAPKPKPTPVAFDPAPSASFIRRYLAENYPGREDEVDVKYVPGEGTFYTFRGIPTLVPDRARVVEELHGRSISEDVALRGPDALPEDSPLRPGGGIVSHPGIEILKGAAKVGELGVLRDIEDRGGLRRTDPKDFSPRRAELEEEVARQTALEVTSILQTLEPLDVPRREIGKPVARAILEPLALATEAAEALSPDNIPGVPSIRGLTRPLVSSGELRGATSVEVLSYITDPLNAVLFAGVAVKAARAAAIGARLTLAESQALRKVLPRARQLLAEEAGGRAPEELVTSLRGVGPGGGGIGIATEGQGLYVARDRATARFFAEDLPGGGIESVRHAAPRNPLVVQNEPLYLLKEDSRIFQPARSVDSVWTKINKEAAEKAGFRSTADGSDEVLARVGRFITEGAQNKGYDAIQIRGTSGNWDVLLDPSLYAAERGGFPARFAGKAKVLKGGPPGGKTLPTKQIVKETDDVKALRTKVSGEGRDPPKPPPPRRPGEPSGLLGGQSEASMSLWRTIESGTVLSSRAGGLLRKYGELLGEAPAIRLFLKALTGPAALARIIPEMRAGMVYRRVQGIMESALGQRLVGSSESFDKLFVLGKGETRLAGLVKDSSKVVIGGKEVAFGDFAEDVLRSARIGAPRGRFPATAGQREWVLTQKELMDDLARQYEFLTGEELRLIDDYWPRFIVGDDGRVSIKGRIGAKQSPVKDRVFRDMEESIARGAAYASPVETVQLYGRAIQKMMRDHMLIQVIKEDKIGRPVIMQLRQEIKALKGRIKGARPSTVDELNEVNVLRNKVDNLQAIATSKKRSLILAKQALGPGFGKTLLEPEAAKVMQDIIGPGLGGRVGTGLRRATFISSIPRFVVTGAMDVGQFFIQGATLLATDPKSWSRVVGHSLTSLFLPEHWSRYLKNSPEAIEAARYGIGRGGIEFLEITKRTGALGRVPGAGVIKAVLGAAPRSFETFIEGGRIFNFSSLARIQRNAIGKAPTGFLPTTSRAAAGLTKAELEGELIRIAGYVKTKLGTTDLMGLGLAVTQRQVEAAFLLYSPRYTRSIFGMLGWALSNGVPARDAQRALATMLFGGLASFYGFARAVGLSHDEAVQRINPASGGKFLALPFGGNEYGFGSAYRATLGFMGSLLRHNSWDFDSWEEAAFDNPLANYLRSRTAPTTGTLIDFIEGEDFLGKEVDLNAFVDDPARILDYGTGKFLPLNLEALFEARGPLEQRILAGLTETVGGRSFPRSAFALFQEAQESVFQEKRVMGQEPYVDFDSFEDLTKENAPAVAVINTDPRVQNAQERLEHESRFRVKTPEGEGFERLEETRITQEKLQLEDDKDFNNGEMAVSVWKDNFRGRQAEFFARRDTIVEDFGLKFGTNKEGVNAAIEAYFGVEGEDFKNLLTGGVDWDRFFAARDATLEGLSSVNLKLVKDYLRRFDTPTVRAFRKAQSDLEEYWAVEDLVWSRLRENEEFAPFLSLNDYLVSKLQALLAQGVPQEEASRTLGRLAVISNVASMVGRLRNRYRLTHSEVDTLLGKWYGLEPAKPQGRRSRRGRRAVGR